MSRTGCGATLIFSGYEKIAESSAEWRLDAAGFRALRRVPWAVTEKVHGANFCLVIEGDAVRGASRRRPLANDEPFFGWQTVRDHLAPALRNAARAVLAGARQATPTGVVARVSVYGELFGGAYPHPEVVTVAGVEPVQTGVWYAPGIHFAAFDVAVEGGDGGDGRWYLDWEAARAILTAAGVPCLAPLRIGTYEQATDYPPRFDSTIPATLGLPPLPVGTNRAEGIVIRPVREITVTGAGGLIRPLLKIKIAEFAEDARFHAARKWADAGAAQSPPTGNALDRLKWEAYCRVTGNRLDATVSKVVPRPNRNRGAWARELFALLSAEVMDEALVADDAAWGALSPGERDEWVAYVRGAVRDLLKDEFGR